LFRIGLAEVCDKSAVPALGAHHAIVDGYSPGLVVDEIVARDSGAVSAPMTQVPRLYRDFAEQDRLSAVEQLEAAAAKHPARTAIVEHREGGSGIHPKYTYAELNAWANRIALWLISQGVRIEELVMIAMRPSRHVPRWWRRCWGP